MSNKREWLMDARRQKNMTRLMLADAVGVHHTYIAKIEDGDRQPSPLVAKSIGEVLGISERDVLLKFYMDKSA